MDAGVAKSTPKMLCVSVRSCSRGSVGVNLIDHAVELVLLGGRPRKRLAAITGRDLNEGEST